ncbi:MAG TPA: hemerythrin domain-containing protein, partial [Polyangia bacterium]
CSVSLATMMAKLLDCLQAQHRSLDECLERTAHQTDGFDHADCLRTFDALVARIRQQFALEEQLLVPIYGPEHAGETADRLRRDHRSIEALLDESRAKLAAGDVEAFRDGAQVLMFKLELHADREERALASELWSAENEEHERAAGLFVERMAPRD